MSVPRNVPKIIQDHVTFELECIDRMYLNVYVPALQCESGVVGFFRRHRGRPFASSALMDPMTKSFVAATERFAQDHGVPVVQFQKGQRKDDVMKEQLRHFDQREGVVFMGQAQEKTPVFRTQRRRNPESGQRYPWIVRSTAMVNHYYLVLSGSGLRPLLPEVLLVLSLQRQVVFERPRVRQVSVAPGRHRLQSTGQTGSSPVPTPGGCKRSVTNWGCCLVFDRRVTKKTPGRFRTRVLTDGVIPSLPVDYKNSRIKQYFKQVPEVPEVGARTQTTINNTRDFYIGKRLCNLPALRQVGFQANRRLLEVECLSHDCAVGEEALHQLNCPVEVNRQRTSALRTTDLRVLALWHILVWFRLMPCGFANRDLREQLAVLTGQTPTTITPGRMTYDLRRLRLHGMIERIPKTHRYRVTPFGLRAALFFTRVHARLYRPAVAEVMSNGPPDNIGLAHRFARLEAEIDKRIRHTKLVA